jgi:hypothetical protein
LCFSFTNPGRRELREREREKKKKKRKKGKTQWVCGGYLTLFPVAPAAQPVNRQTTL